jgi:hypothetical protein
MKNAMRLRPVGIRGDDRITEPDKAQLKVFDDGNLGSSRCGSRSKAE